MTKIASKERATINSDKQMSFEHCLGVEMDEDGTVTFDDMLRDFILPEHFKSEDEPSQKETLDSSGIGGHDSTFTSPEALVSEPLQASAISSDPSMPIESSYSLPRPIGPQHVVCPPAIFVGSNLSDISQETDSAVIVTSHTKRSSRNKPESTSKIDKRTTMDSQHPNTSRREQVLERNRAAAARCRQKKKVMEVHMKEEVEKLRMENEVLTRERDYWMNNCSNLLFHKTLIPQETFSSIYDVSSIQQDHGHGRHVIDERSIGLSLGRQQVP